MKYYVLDKSGFPKPEPDLNKWTQFFEDTENRRVAWTDLPDGVNVSTVFLGVDHSWSGKGPPVLWETMIFGGPHDQEQWRYSSLTGARLGHDHAVKLARGEEQ